MKCGVPQASRDEQGQSVSLFLVLRFVSCGSLHIRHWREDGVPGLFIAWLAIAVLFGVAISSILIGCVVGNAFSVYWVSIDSGVHRIRVFWPEPGSYGIVRVQVFDLTSWQRSYQQL